MNCFEQTGYHINLQNENKLADTVVHMGNDDEQRCE